MPNNIDVMYFRYLGACVNTTGAKIKYIKYFKSEETDFTEIENERQCRFLIRAQDRTLPENFIKCFKENSFTFLFYY